MKFLQHRAGAVNVTHSEPRVHQGKDTSIGRHDDRLMRADDLIPAAHAPALLTEVSAKGLCDDACLPEDLSLLHGGQGCGRSEYGTLSCEVHLA